MKKNKKIIALAAMVVMLTAGGTYAWFTSEATFEQAISMGSLKIETNYKAKTLKNIEPGETNNPEDNDNNKPLQGTIKNSGSLWSIMRLERDVQVKLKYSDNNLTPIEEAEQKFSAAPKEIMSFKFAPTNGYESDNDFWFKDGQDRIYLVLAPSKSVKFDLVYKIDGPNTGNMYQLADITAGMKIQATQDSVAGAMEEVLGVSFDELEPIFNEDEEGNATGMQTFSVNLTPAQRYLMEKQAELAAFK